MKCLVCILLCVFASLNGGMSEDCSYESCDESLEIMGLVPALSEAYCAARKMLKECLEVHVVQCPDTNVARFTTLLDQYQSSEPCPDVGSTSTLLSTSTVLPSTSMVTPQATSTLDCTYEVCQTWLSYMSILEELTPEYCRVYKELSACVGGTYEQCGENNNMATFAALFGQLSMKPACPDTVTTTTATPVVTSTSIQPSPTISSSAIPSPTIILDCTLNYCGDLVQRLDGMKLNDTNYCRYLREGYDCLEYTSEQCEDENFLVYLLLKDTFNSYQQCNDTIPSPTSSMPSISTTASPKPTCLHGLPADVEFNNDLPNFVPLEIVDNEHKCSDIEQEEGDIYYHCSFYTYSHLRAFRSADLYTCSSPGLWALFSHPSLQVTVLNVVPDLRETYTLADEVNIVIPKSKCSQRKIYHVSSSSGHLPTTFDDGTEDTDGLQLFVNSNKTSAYIRIPWINTTIAVHKLAGLVGVVILSPQVIAGESVGLCSLGCPDHSKFLIEDVPSQSYSEDCEQEAIKACSINEFAVLKAPPATTDDFYIDRCIFDVLKSDKVNSSWMSVVMVQDLQSLGPIGAPPSEPSTTTPWPVDILDNYQDKIDPNDYDGGDIPDTFPGLALPEVHRPQEQAQASQSTLTASSSILLMVWCILQWHAIHYILYT